MVLRGILMRGVIMKCNKCGTPIIPGENACRICGNKTDFSQRGKEPEIIDFPEEIKVEEIKVKEEKKVEPKKVEIAPFELPDLDDIINSNELDSKPDFDDVKQPELVIPDTMELELPTEDLKDEVSEPNVQLSEEEPKVEKVKSKKKKSLDKVVVKEEPKKNKVKPKKKEKKSGNFGMILLIIILLCSLFLNIYLFVNGKNEGTNEKPTNNEETVYSKVSYDGYKHTIPSSWITENKGTSLLVYDDTQNWSASTQIIENANYEAFVTNKDKLVESLGALKYQFTSNYSKEANEKDYYLFKGKYYNYSVYVIVTGMDDDKLIVTDLKFKGEVDDILLNNILTFMSTVKENNNEELFKDNFEFKDFSNEISSISQIEE